MHDIWNPWHGCRKVSEGCQNCYTFFLDKQRGKDGGDIYRTKAGFRYPLSKDRSGQYKVKSGEMLRVCMTSDFFLEEADPWRDEAWEIIAQRPDVKFFLLTKRPERVERCLPRGWGDGWDNVMLNVTAENQRRLFFSDAAKNNSCSRPEKPGAGKFYRDSISLARKKVLNRIPAICCIPGGKAVLRLFHNDKRDPGFFCRQPGMPARHHLCLVMGIED